MKNAFRMWRRPWWLGAILAVVVMLGWVVPAGASTVNPYPTGSPGYDVGQPNCGETPPGGFAIVGLGGGRPFTTNACLSSEWATASTSSAVPGPALYFNTGYAGAYGRDVTPSCTTYRGPSLATFPKRDQSAYAKAWEIGCSESAYAAAMAQANGEVPSMWWADIESGNSWSTNQTVNQFTVDGISYEIQKAAPGISGVYSYTAAWDKLVGSGFTATPAFDGDWGPGLSCTTAGFSGAPAWVVQGGTSSSGVDTDTGCG
jgi:hypothetical protein